jgi:hypothetical protein
MSSGDSKVVGGCLDGGQLYLGTLPLDILVDLHGMQHLFMVLHHKPVGKAFEALLVAVGRHGHIKEGRIHFPVDLFIQSLGHFITDHGSLLSIM